MNDILLETIEGLERDLTVRLIAAAPLACCSPDAVVEHVLAESILTGFDRIPVRDGEQVVGVLLREELDAGTTAREAMTPLSDSLLISADAPVSTVIELLVAGSYRLMVDGGHITGIVTRSDLLKLPVRTYAFTLITHLEMVMARVVHSRWGDGEGWLNVLSPGRRRKVRQKQEDLARSDDDLPLLELTDFCDKRDLTRKALRLTRMFTREMGQIEDLRDKLAHAGDYARDGSGLQEFVTRLRLAEEWTHYLGKHLASAGGSPETGQANG